MFYSLKKKIVKNSTVFNKLITKQQHRKPIKIKKIDKRLWQVPLLLLMHMEISLFLESKSIKCFTSFFSITESFNIIKNSAISSWLNKNPPTQLLLLLILFLKSDPLLSQIHYRKKQLTKIFSITQYIFQSLLETRMYSILKFNSL